MELEIGSVGIADVVLVSMDSNEGESNSLDVDIVDLRIDEDVVDVQVHVRDRLCLNSRVVCQDRSHSDVFLDIGDGDGSGSSGSSSSAELIFSSESEEQVSRSREDNLVLCCNVDGNESMTVWNGNRGDGESRISVEPEDERNPQIEGRLDEFWSLWAVDDLSESASTLSSVDWGGSGGSAIDVDKSGICVWRCSGDRHQVGVSLNRDFLSDESLPPGHLVWRNLELLEIHIRFGGVIIKRISVHVEFHLLEDSLTWEFSISSKVGCSVSDFEHVSLNVNVFVGVFGVDSISRVGVSGDRCGSSDYNVACTDGRWEGRDDTSIALCRTESHVDDHIIEEVTELRNGELD